MSAEPPCSPPKRRTSSPARSSSSRGRMRENVLPPSSFFSMRNCLSANAAICARCETAMICVVFAMSANFFRYDARRLAADTRIDLIKDVCSDGSDRRELRLDRQHEAAHLAAADDLAELFDGLARIGGKEEFDAVQTLRMGAREVFFRIRVEGDLEAGGRDIERFELFRDPPRKAFRASLRFFVSASHAEYSFFALPSSSALSFSHSSALFSSSCSSSFARERRLSASSTEPPYFFLSDLISSRRFSTRSASRSSMSSSSASDSAVSPMSSISASALSSRSERAA